MSSETKENLIGLRLSDKELERLDALADYYGLSRVNVLRTLVKRAHDVYEGTKRKDRTRKRRADPSQKP